MKAEISVLRLAIEEAKEQSEREANEENLVIVFLKKIYLLEGIFYGKLCPGHRPPEGRPA